MSADCHRVLSSVPERFVAQARHAPQALAVTDGSLSRTYATLLAEAEAVAAAVAHLPADRPVGVRGTRGVASVASLLGVMLSGRAYVPFDPRWPSARVRAVAAAAGTSAVLDAERLARLARGEPGHRPAPDPGDPAYVLFTSGSSGSPKGVEISHRGLTNLVDAFVDRFALDASDTVLHVAPLTFDVSVWEVFVPLSCGAAVCVADETTVSAPGRLTDLMRDHCVSVVDMMPSLLDVLDPAELPDLRIVMTGIERVGAETVDRWSGTGRRVFNGYGPTEATVIATLMECRAGAGDPPIGRPLPNMTAVVVDPQTAERVARGQPGELWLAGPQLATRYLGASAEQEAAFVQRTFPDLSPTRWYRTGDAVSCDDAGELHFHGRLDDQIKIRGQRVDLRHVEAAAKAHPSVADAIVSVIGTQAATRLRLSYVAPAVAGVMPAPGPSLCEHLQTVLPPYMVPAELQALAELPRLPNGKVDRRALIAGPDGPDAGLVPPPEAGADASVRAHILTVLTEVIGTDAVDGESIRPMDSLSAIRVAGRLRQRLGVQATAPQILKAGDVTDLVRLCGEDAATPSGAA